MRYTLTNDFHGNRNYRTPKVDPQWAASRETAMPVAVAIHAISSHDRTPQAIWESPTQAEWDHVCMAVEEYVRHGDVEADPDGFPWGVETIPSPTETDQ